jgi:CRP-like cAMP-binding protein/Ca2+-binding EF-hand superfamily protein
MAFAGHLLIVSMMYAVAVPFLWPLLGAEDPEISVAVWLIVGVSAAANLVIMGYHYLVPPHPKFLLSGWRRLILRLHVLAGTVELIAGLVILLGFGQRTPAIVMALTALCVHVPTAYYQTSAVFGSRAVMRPAYLMCIGLHAFCAAQLLTHPDSTYWVVATFLIFNVYVWCRLYYYVFDKFGLFEGSRYTASICFAGLTTIPAVLGPSTILLLGLGIAIYMALYNKFFIRGPEEYWEFMRERARDASPVDNYMALLDNQSEDESVRAGDHFFRSIDIEGRGGISIEDLCRCLASSGGLTEGLRSSLKTRFGEATLDFEDFIDRVWPIQQVRRHALVVAATAAARSDRDKAEFVFDLLDLDRDGQLKRSEFEALTSEWGMPGPEADQLLNHLGLTDGGQMDFDQFFRQLRPVWRFVYYDVVDAKHGRRQDMLARAMTAEREARATRAVRRDLRRELVQHVDFLQNPDDDFLNELADSLVEVSHPAGTILFTEGDQGEHLFLVRRGQLTVDRGGEPLGTIAIGGWVGEGALLDGTTRAATVRALQDTVLFEMSRSSFQYLLGKHPAVASTLDHVHEERRLDDMRRSLQRELLADVSFLGTAGTGPLDALVEALERDSIEGTVFHEGDPGDRFYLVGSGRVRILHNGLQVAELSTGAYFGEGALLSGNPRTATAEAVGPSTLYSLDRAGFDSIIQSYPTLAATVQEANESRQRELQALDSERDSR